MEMTLEEFQEASKKRKKVAGRRPAPYGAEQRGFAVEYARRELKRGVSRSAVLRALGISDGTLSKWLPPKTKSAGKGFRRVLLKTETKADGELTVVTPRGFRVEGLSVESAVRLLSALG